MKTVIRMVIGFLLITLLPKASMASNHSMWDMNQTVPVAAAGGGGEKQLLAAAEGQQNVSEKTEADGTQGAEPMKLSIEDFVRLVRGKNEQISFQDAEWAIKREAVQGAKSIFEPALVGSYQYSDDNRRNTVQELVSQGFIPEFYEKSDTYQAAVEGLIPTGGRVRVGYSLKDFSNSIDARYGVEREAQTVLGGSVTQPLLKGGGIRPTMAGIQVAEADADIAFQTYRQQMMRVVSEAMASYWDLYLAREKYKMRKESEHNAEALLQDNIARAKTGKMADTEVLEAEAGLALRKSLVSEAKQAIVISANSVRTFLSSSAAESKVDIEPAEQLIFKEVQMDYAESLSKAFKMRAEYIASRKKLKREDIRLVFAKNQRWPQLDLKGSYNLNGLADNPGNSWEDTMTRDFESWSIGVELRIPLGGDKKSRSELLATRQRKRQALIEMKSVEVAMANEVDTAIKNVFNAREQAGHYASVVDMNQRLLEAEIARFKAGKSNSRILLEREEDLNKAKEAKIESLVKYQKALLQFELTEGTILINHGIEVMEADL